MDQVVQSGNFGGGGGAGGVTSVTGDGTHPSSAPVLAGGEHVGQVR